MSEEKKLFPSSDFPLICTLHYFGHDIVDVKPMPTAPSRKEFFFEDNEELQELLKDYVNGRIKVEPSRFCTSNRVIKEHLYNNTKS